MTDYSARSEFGDLSSKVLREADCKEGKIRALAYRFYKEPMGGGVSTGYSDRLGQWKYVTPDTMGAVMALALCRDNR